MAESITYQKRPPRVGGLATPLGVYMTSGYLSSGSKIPGLLSVGAVFALALMAIEASYVVFFSGLSAMYSLFARIPMELELQLHVFYTVLMIVLMIRLTPLSGLHAAEHMTINAIENCLEIRPEVVRQQPKEHVRCGTNLTVILVGFQIGWLMLDSITNYLSWLGTALFILFWCFLVLKYWKACGIWVQTYFTTQKPSDAQLNNGIAAGIELLEKYNQNPHSEPNILIRIWGSGVVYVLLGFALTTFAVQTILYQFFQPVS